jgi:pimeloyl-ACP methyl ester carboxylesterase
MTLFSSFDGTKLYYEDEGAGAPVLLLHGFTSSIEGNWRQPGIWDTILDAGKRVIGLDARGHGRSEKPHEVAAYQNQAMVRDMRALFAHLGLGHADVVGYSMGAGTAVRFAANETRVRRLVLGGIGGDPADSAPRERLAARGQRMLAGLESDDPAALEDKLARRTRRVAEARGNDLKAMAAVLRAGGIRDGYDPGAVTAPTLVVCGDKDVAPDALARALPDATSLVLAGDHEGVVTNPELAASIASFLNA